MFVDSVKVYVSGGRGGDGALSFRREKYVPRGGPDGGRGGDGGDVIFMATSHKNTLIDLGYRPHLKAQNGSQGEGGRRNGKRGEPLLVEVPLGTIIKDEDGTQLADLNSSRFQVVAAQGGRGGRGNASFASSRRRTPRFAEKGEPGEERTLLLELKVLADVGMIGYPNAGKSTFLARVSAAAPKIADYPFTTLVPQLGVVYLGEERSFVIADLPGIIEGAHQGAGLGHHFLKHIERTRVLLFILDMAAVDGSDPAADYQKLCLELQKYNPALLSRPRVIAANKMDLPEARDNLERFKKSISEEWPLFTVSAATGEGVTGLLEEIYRCLAEERALHLQPEGTAEQETIYLPPSFQYSFTSVQREGDLFIVRGTEVEKAVRRIDLESEDGVNYFQQVIETLGVENELKKKGIKEGDTVIIGEHEFTFR